MKKRSTALSRPSEMKYILTNPASLSEINLDEIDEKHDSQWRERARQLQARRWRKLRHQLA